MSLAVEIINAVINTQTHTLYIDTHTHPHTLNSKLLLSQRRELSCGPQHDASAIGIDMVTVEL
jgi:hypothetical protein